MSDETVISDDGGESLPVVNAPKSDAEAAVLESADAAEAQDSETPKPDPVAPDKEERQRNRTTQYIERQKQELADLRRQLSEARISQPAQQAAKAPAEGEPSLADHDYDIAAFTRAHADWAVTQALTRRDHEQQKLAQENERHDALSRYEDQIQQVIDERPDFYEVVATIDPAFITPELEAAIIKHPKGALIAYHIGTNDDDAFLLASTRPELVAAAVDRLAKRITAAPAATHVAAPPRPKPITQAPAPPPSLSGKAPVTTPSEKLTDEQWLARENDRLRKR